MWSTAIHPDRRRALRKLDKQWLARLNLRLVSLTFTLFSFIAFTACIPTWSNTFFHATGAIRGDWTDGLPLLPLILILFFDIYTIRHTICLCHPPNAKTITIIETLILLLLTPALVFAVVGSLFIHFSAAVPQKNGEVQCSALQNFLSRQCNPALYTVGSLQLLGVVFGCMVWILHVSLALWGAIDTRRNRQRSTNESALERRRRVWRAGRRERGTTRTREPKGVDPRIGTGAYQTHGWYR